MTAVAEDLDLSWVTFTDDESLPCDWRLGGQCTFEAVVLAVWDRVCHEGAPNPQALCAEHRDYLVRGASLAGGRFRCAVCDSVCYLLRIEPVR